MGQQEPDEKAWSAYIKMEVRYGELDRASAVYERLVACHPEPKLFTKWSKFEEDRGRIDRAREIFQMGLEFFGEEEEQLEKAQGLVRILFGFVLRQSQGLSNSSSTVFWFC
jgi:crooked neck